MPRKPKQAEIKQDTDVSSIETVQVETCHRCGHAAELNCHCVAFVYPPDQEGQHHLPGEEFAPSESQQELWPLTMAVKRAQDERMRLTKVEIEARECLLVAMKKHNLTVWSYKGIEAEIDPGKEKVKVHATGEGTLPI